VGIELLKITAIQVAIGYIGQLGSPEAIAGCLAPLPTDSQWFKVVLFAGELVRSLGISLLVDANMELLGCFLEQGFQTSAKRRGNGRDQVSGSLWHFRQPVN
jgi:hypothetical protein